MWRLFELILCLSPSRTHTLYLQLGFNMVNMLWIYNTAQKIWYKGNYSSYTLITIGCLELLTRVWGSPTLLWWRKDLRFDILLVSWTCRESTWIQIPTGEKCWSSANSQALKFVWRAGLMPFLLLMNKIHLSCLRLFLQTIPSSLNSVCNRPLAPDPQLAFPLGANINGKAEVCSVV